MSYSSLTTPATSLSEMKPLTSVGRKREHVGCKASGPRNGMHVWWKPSLS